MPSNRAAEVNHKACLRSTTGSEGTPFSSQGPIPRLASARPAADGGRVEWADTVRAVCMVSVYLVHSEVYYGTGGVSFGYWLLPFYVAAFFFVSGYLFFSRFMECDDRISQAGTMLRRAAAGVFARLVGPTLLFSTLIYVPKKLFHGDALSLAQYVHDVFGGVSYWFTSALAVSQLLLLLLLGVCRRKCLLVCSVVSCVCLAVGVRAANVSPDPFPWNYQAALEATFFICLGGLFRRYACLVRHKLFPAALALACGAYVLYVAFTWKSGSLAVYLPFIAGHTEAMVLLCGIVFVVALAHILPCPRWLGYVGRNSIVFYFFSGVFPAMCGTLARMVFPSPSYGVTLLVAVVSLGFGVLASWVVKRYFPFAIDFRQLLRVMHGQHV